MHYKMFLPGYSLHECMQLYPTFNGMENLDGYTKEYMCVKIETFTRLCWKVGELVNMVNNELYSMHIPSDTCDAWNLLRDAHRICHLMCIKYTELLSDVGSNSPNEDTLECVKEIKCMLGHLKYCSLYNPRDNISPISINLLSRILTSTAGDMESYLNHIEETHRNVQAE